MRSCFAGLANEKSRFAGSWLSEPRQLSGCQVQKLPATDNEPRHGSTNQTAQSHKALCYFLRRNFNIYPLQIC